ncbi:hypothetical protein GQ55_3G241200 [Panicum hallii var. hallii]|uniref:Uncharacterized protein n=1 Tax=Panicum hallii var. hallii TaxID=1504633 RepID=A0A2T7ECV0_9POAL|nr:hypothetical protein GQ55_3G241200 [Panicum hallii var. hallii]
MSWSDLPVDIAAAIADRLTEVADLARFRSVCPSWRSASSAHAARRRAPLLLLPTQYHCTVISRRAWSLADGSLAEVLLPAARGRSFLFASNHGWTLAVSGRDLSATLVHPFTGASSDLLALSFCHGDHREAVLRELAWEWSPHGVLVSPRKGAFFCRPGDGSWRPVGCSSASISSITYCDGVFYLFDGKTCKATVVDAETLAVAAVIEPPALEIPWSDFETSLVVSPDELLLLVKSWCWERRHGRFVKAFRADRLPPAGGRNPSWSQVGDIGERAVFVDHLRAFCVEANGLNGVRRNCMYLASSHEQVINDYYGVDVCRMYTVSVLDCSDPVQENLGHESLLNVEGSTFWQCPSWLLPNPH